VRCRPGAWSACTRSQRRRPSRSAFLLASPAPSASPSAFKPRTAAHSGSAPVALEITSSRISAGDTIYVTTPTGLSPIGAASLNGAAAISVTGNTTVLLASLTARRFSVSEHTPVTLVGFDAATNAQTELTAELIVANSRRRSATVTVDSAHRFTWSLGKLATGTYTARFTLAGTVVKTTTIVVTAAR
jgi:hypothetical protein